MSKQFTKLDFYLQKCFLSLISLEALKNSHFLDVHINIYGIPNFRDFLYPTVFAKPLFKLG